MKEGFLNLCFDLGILFMLMDTIAAIVCAILAIGFKIAGKNDR